MANVLCVAGVNSKYKVAGAKPAGFFAGLWHGVIAIFTFILSFFDARVCVWETNNNGHWYEFGFLLGAGVFSSKVSHHSCC